MFKIGRVPCYRTVPTLFTQSLQLFAKACAVFISRAFYTAEPLLHKPFRGHILYFYSCRLLLISSILKGWFTKMIVFGRNPLVVMAVFIGGTYLPQIPCWLVSQPIFHLCAGICWHGFSQLCGV